MGCDECRAWSHDARDWVGCPSTQSQMRSCSRWEKTAKNWRRAVICISFSPTSLATLSFSRVGRAPILFGWAGVTSSERAQFEGHCGYFLKIAEQHQCDGGLLLAWFACVRSRWQQSEDGQLVGPCASRRNVTDSMLAGSRDARENSNLF